MTCLLDLGVKTVGCRPHAPLHKCVVTRFFLCGSQRVEKSQLTVCTSDEQVCLRTPYARHKHSNILKGHSRRIAPFAAKPDIYLYLLLPQSYFIYSLSQRGRTIYSLLAHFADCILFCSSSEEFVLGCVMQLPGSVWKYRNVCKRSIMYGSYLFDGYFLISLLCV